MNKSPFEKNSLDSCLRLAKRGSTILLIEDAVYAAIDGTSVAAKLKAATQHHNVYALGPDLKARGLDIDQVIDGIRVVNYDGFVDLAVENETIQSWL